MNEHVVYYNCLEEDYFFFKKDESSQLRGRRSRQWMNHIIKILALPLQDAKRLAQDRKHGAR